MALKDYYNTNDDNQAAFGNSAATWHAQTFLTTSAYTVASVKIKVFRNGGHTGTMTLSIRATSGSDPTGADLTSGTLNIADISETSAPGGWYEISVTPYTLSNATTYAIVVRDDTSDNTYWRVDSGNGYANGEIRVSSDSGSSWGAWAGGIADGMFETHTAATIFSELSGTIAAVSVVGPAALAQLLSLSGTIAVVSTVGPSSLGQVAVSLGESVAIKRLVAVGNDRLYYEDI